jgi:hypothetical protein
MTKKKEEDPETNACRKLGKDCRMTKRKRKGNDKKEGGDPETSSG